MSRHLDRVAIVVLAAALAVLPGIGAPALAQTALAGRTTPGTRGGTLVVPQRAELRTFNPVTALDAPSRDVLRRVMGDLVRINRATLATEPALAESWTRSKDGRTLTVTLRSGLRFSDGQPCTADDVVFSFAVYLDEAVGSPQRDLLVVGGRPLDVRKIDARRIAFTFAQPYAPAERLFDSVAILPRHKLERIYRDGGLAKAWSTATAPAEIVGLGPFRVAEHVPGERTVLERNPYYWRRDAAGTALPYIERLVFVVVANDDAQAVRFQAGELDLLTRITPATAGALTQSMAGKARIVDAGPTLDFNFLFFNLTPVPTAASPDVVARRGWFADVRFRRAVAHAVDRPGMARLVYQGKARPIWSLLSPANRPWYNTAIPERPRSIAGARAELGAAGFTWRAGVLHDATGRPVRFTIAVAASNQQRQQMATIVQQDLAQLGMQVDVVPLEFRALLDRVTRTFDYDACVLGLASGDADPAADVNVWKSSGPTHLWHPDQAAPATPWEREIDQLMDQQFQTLDPARRKALFDRVQAIAHEHVAMVPLVTPHLLVAAPPELGNLRPAALDHPTLWNADELFWTTARARERRR